ncbi:hypothetical protein [Streptomyces sp. NTH33]|uniref:hypothetical protein n=1 Tax=Streptomyces sp. NTH33 TaxID=1735453 RepID=UPI000DA97C96|nr:hypothetical protein [Streptomyces sp. NTH33]
MVGAWDDLGAGRTPSSPAALDTLLTADLETGSLHNVLRRLGLRPTLGSSVPTARTAGDGAPELGVDAATPMLVETRSIADQYGAPWNTRSAPT